MIDGVNERGHPIFSLDLCEPAADVLEAGLRVKCLNRLVNSLMDGVLSFNPWLMRRGENIMDFFHHLGGQVLQGEFQRFFLCVLGTPNSLGFSSAEELFLNNGFRGSVDLDVRLDRTPIETVGIRCEKDLSYVQSKAASLGRGLRLNPKPVSYSWSFLL